MTQSAQSSVQGRQLLIDVARRQFLERGFAHVSIQQIAEEAKMTKGAPYYHFANKQDLFIQVSLDILVDLKRILDAALDSEGSFQQRIERVIIEVVRSLSGDFSLWYSDFVQLDDKKAIAKSLDSTFGSAQITDLFLPSFERAREEGEITRVSAQVASTTFFLLLKSTIDNCYHESIRFPEQKRDLDQFVKQIVDVYFHGIA